MEKQYVLGIDYGTESGRVLIVRVDTGEIIAQKVIPYSHGVLTTTLPDGLTKLDPEAALQVPQDYINVLIQAIPTLLIETNLASRQIIGIGLDFTASTILPVTNTFTPLCEVSRYQNRPHAFVKLWKHHAARKEADYLNELAQETQWIQRYGGTVSAEWMIPKLMEIAHEDPEVYAATDLFIEAGDWVVARLTGQLSRSSCAAGYKGMWHKKDGYVHADFLEQLAPEMATIYEDKLRGEVKSLGGKAGCLTKEMAALLQLEEGIAVGVGIIDAHAALPGTGVSEPGTLVMVMGTSTCHLVLSEKEAYIPGISGVVEDGILPGYYAYEAGQAAVGDLFAWFVNEKVPCYLAEEARIAEISLHELLARQAAELLPGKSGLVALDWHNGNRTPWVDLSLTGLVIGERLSTTPAELYRAYLEATAFGTRVIVDLFAAHDIPIRQLVASGGIPEKNPVLMQIYADVLQREVTVNLNSQAPALGAAILGAVAAGKENGGYDSVSIAIEKMASTAVITYYPNKQHKEIYDDLFSTYEKLSRLFAEETTIMKKLAQLKER